MRKYWLVHISLLNKGDDMVQQRHVREVVEGLKRPCLYFFVCYGGMSKRFGNVETTGVLLSRDDYFWMSV